MVVIRLIIAILLIEFSCPLILFAQDQKRAELQIQERKRKKTKKEKVTGPRRNRSALFSVRVERKLIKGIDKTVKYLEKTAKSLPKKSQQRLQILERILNLYMEQATYVRSEEERVYDNKMTRWEDSGKKGREPKLDSSRSMRYWKLVSRQASLILKEFPKAKTADSITFNRAIALQYLGKDKSSASMFNRLIKNYPNSEIAGDAYAALGDYFFDRNDYRNAQKNFKKARKYKRSNRYLWSIFKLGWCSFNLGNYKNALGHWKSLVSTARKNRDDKAAQQLKEESLRDMVYAFAELKQVEQAIAYYKANGGTTYIGPFLTLLAQTLADQGEYSKSIKVLKKYQTTLPFDPKGPDSQKEIVSLNGALGRYKQLWRELERFETLYGRTTSWARRNPKEVSETQNMIKDQMIYWASLTHQKAIKDDNRRLNQEAKKGYLIFLKYFPRSEEVSGIKYYLGDIEYYLKNYRQAGQYYYEIASLGKNRATRFDSKKNKKVNIHREVSIYMVNSYVNDFEPEFKVLKKRTPDFSKPKQLSSRAQNYILACNRYVKWYPKDKTRVKSCDTGIANIYYHSGRRKEAVAYLKKLAITYPGDKEGEGAIELLIPMMANDKKALLNLSYNFLRIPEYRRGKMGAKLRNLQRGAEKEAISQEKDIFKRAQLYEAQAKKYPKDPDVDKLWYNAAVDYIKAGAIPQAISAYLVIVKRFSKTPQAKESLLQIAQIYERLLDFDKASSYFIEYYNKYSKSKEAAASLARACEMQLALNTSKALSICNSFANRYREQALPIVERLIIGAFRGNRNSQMVQIINNMYLNRFRLNQNQKIIAYYRIYAAYKGQGNQAAQAASAIFSEFSKSPNSVSGEALRYVGELTFQRANAVLPRYLKVGLAGGTVEKLLASMQNKAAQLQQVEQAFGQVVNTKDSYWGVAALYSIGFATEQFAQLLSNPPAIQGAKREDVLTQLKPQIDQIKQAAANWYKTAADTVSRYRVYNDYSVRTINSLSRVSGGNLQFDDYVVTPDFLGAELPADIAKNLR